MKAIVFLFTRKWWCVARIFFVSFIYLHVKFIWSICCCSFTVLVSACTIMANEEEHCRPCPRLFLPICGGPPESTPDKWQQFINPCEMDRHNCLQKTSEYFASGSCEHHRSNQWNLMCISLWWYRVSATGIRLLLRPRQICCTQTSGDLKMWKKCNKTELQIALTLDNCGWFSSYEQNLARKKIVRCWKRKGAQYKLSTQ